MENRNIQPRQELFGVFAGAVLCGISGFCLDGLWKSASGGGFWVDFLVSGGVPTATNRSLWTDFFCFLWESRGFCPPAFVDIRWGLAVGLGNLSVRFFMHIHRTAEGVFFCCNARIRGLRGVHTAMHTVLFNIVFHRL